MLYNPDGRLRNQNMFKLVFGDWRVIYTSDFTNKIITVHLIGHRKEIYKI
jgi:mRNA interferase RelE/StbE